MLEALGRDDAVLLTASPFGADPRVTGPLRALKVPRRLGRDRDAFRAWLQPLLREFDELIVDTFPGGILGELCGLTLPPATLIARRLRWEVYESRLDGPLPVYAHTYEVEPLGVGEPLALPRARRSASRWPTSRTGSSCTPARSTSSTRCSHAPRARRS